MIYGIILVDRKREVGFMFWKMTNLQLKKGYTFLLNGDSAPFFRKICRESEQQLFD